MRGELTPGARRGRSHPAAHWESPCRAGHAILRLSDAAGVAWGGWVSAARAGWLLPGPGNLPADKKAGAATSGPGMPLLL